ncbi:MAG: T9SS type A sorting domain-containing protein [Rhodothermales bacterium]|nr:T9SS type A sorting domain-containing protein [Rhodothermales bacterium]
MTGFTQGDGSTFDYATVKYDASGNEEWVREYHGQGLGQDEAWDIAVDASGNVYVTGWTTELLGVDYSTVKYNADGEQQWVARYDGPIGGGDRGRKIAVDAAGDIYVAGTARGAVSFNYAIVKYDPAGSEQWVALYDGPSNFDDGLSDLVLDADGNVYVGGTSFGVSTNTDYAIVRYSPLGVEQWVFRHDGPTSDGDGLHALAVDVDGNVYATGSTGNSGSGTSQYMTVKFSQPLGTAVESNEELVNVSFNDVYPNPFGSSTTIGFVLNQPSRVSISIFDMTGREVVTVQDRFLADGTHAVTWNATVLPAGVYLCTINVGSTRLTKKLIHVH